MLSITNQSVPDNYGVTGNGALFYAYNSPGGFLNITQQPVLMQLASGKQGQEKWSTDMPIPIGGVTLPRGTIGFRCKNQVAGQTATLSAAIAEEYDLVPLLGATGVSGGATNLRVGSVAANGAVVAGTGFAVNHPGGGQYDFTFTVPFASPPAVLVQPFQHTVAIPIIEPGTVTQTQFRVIMFNAAGAQIDVAFFFAAQAI